MIDIQDADHEVQRVGQIELDEDLTFLKRAWKVERVGWIVMALIVLAALLGLFGRGPLSRATAGTTGDPVRLEYERFTRHSSPATLQVHLAPKVADNNGTARVWLDREYMQDVNIEDISPEPERMEAGRDGIVYVFRIAHPDRPTRVTFHIQPNGYGSRPGRIGLMGKEPLRFRQFIFP